MAQEIILAANSETPIRPLIQSAISSELDKIKWAIFRTKKRMHTFEKEYGMSSDRFRQKFANAELSESLDYIEWFGEIKTMEILVEQKKALEGIDFVDQ